MHTVVQGLARHKALGPNAEVHVEVVEETESDWAVDGHCGGIWLIGHSGTGKDNVIAIGAVAIRHNAIDLGDQFDLILRRPELDISETVLIHGIGPEALTQGHETEDALLHLLEWMNGDPILAYHSAFDQKFLEKALKQTLGYTQPHTWLDVAEMLPAYFPNSKTGGKGLDNWADFFDLEVSARHHAAADAMVTAELTLAVINKAQKSGVTSLRDFNGKLKYYRQLKNIHRQG